MKQLNTLPALLMSVILKHGNKEINFQKLTKQIILSITCVCCLCNNANAVRLDASELPNCYLPMKDSSSAIGSIGLEFYLCEDFNFFSAIFIGDFVDQGQSVSFDWEGFFWAGSVQLNRSLNDNNNRQLLASGSGQHIRPYTASDTWEFENLVGGGTGNISVETFDGTFGGVEHNDNDFDRYTASLRLDEGRALYNIDTNPQAFERGFLLEIKGRHNNGPYCIQYAPGGKQCVEFLPLGFFAVPTPGSLSLLLLGLLGLSQTSRIKRRVRKIS